MTYQIFRLRAEVAKLIRDFKSGERITDFFLLKQMELKVHEGGSRLVLVLGDRTGSIDAVVWDQAEAMKTALDGAEVVKVQGLVGSFKGRPQLKVERIRSAQIGEFDLANLKRASSRQIEDLKQEFTDLVNSLENPHIKSLLLKLSEDDELYGSYFHFPAGTRWHHDYISGLIDHSLSMARLVDLVCRNYPELDRDLLIAGALLHDIGKTVEFEGELVFEYSDAGRLVGHIVIGNNIVVDLIRQLPDFPKVLELKLRHLILSHHGQLEHGAVVKPLTAEAHLLHHLDQIDSKLDAIKKISEKTDDKWSEYIRPLESYLYFGDKEE